MPDALTTAEAPDVAFHHRRYDHFLPQWIKCRDAVEGEEAVKAKTYQYLPELQGAEEGENAAYRSRAEFFGASYRTVQGLAGAVTRKPATVVWPDAMKEMLTRLGNGGESLELLTSIVLEEVLTTGRIGVYVDAPEGDNAEPYITTYCPENIINWRSEPGPDGRQVYTLIVLKEEHENCDSSDFASEVIEQYRVLRLSGDPEPVYTVEVYHKIETSDGKGNVTTAYVQQGETVEPKMRGGKRFTEIPFIFFSPGGITGHIEKSPILDLVNVNLSHYRYSADLAHGHHWVALPTPWASGVKFEGKPKIGPTGMLHSEDMNAKFGMLEFTGAGLKSLQDELDKKERRMAILGARLLEGQKSNGVEAAETVRLRNSGEHSVLSNVATTVSAGLTKALQWVRDWMGASGDASVALSQDFNATTLDAPTMTALLMQYIQGAISYEVYFYNMSRGDMFPDGMTQEMIRDQIAAGGPLLPPPQLTQDEADGGGTAPKVVRGGEVIGATD